MRVRGRLGGRWLLVLAAAIAVAVGLAAVGCGGDGNPSGGGNNTGGGETGGGGTLSCGNRECATAVMPDGLTWMTENLNKATDNSRCYKNSADSCNKYGRLYTLEAARKACQSVGMRLPAIIDWFGLIYYSGGGSGASLKAKSGWNNNGNGTDDFGFSALPGGYVTPGGRFNGVGNGGYWWIDDNQLEALGLAYYVAIFSTYGTDGMEEPESGLSVRCVSGKGYMDD